MRCTAGASTAASFCRAIKLYNAHAGDVRDENGDLNNGVFGIDNNYAFGDFCGIIIIIADSLLLEIAPSYFLQYCLPAIAHGLSHPRLRLPRLAHGEPLHGCDAVHDAVQPSLRAGNVPLRCRRALPGMPRWFILPGRRSAPQRVPVRVLQYRR